MAEAIQCGQCGKRYKFKPELAGKAIKCPACGGVIRVPEAPKLKPPAATPAIADTLSFVDEELAAEAARQDAIPAETAPWQAPSMSPSAPAAGPAAASQSPSARVNPYQTTYVPRRPEPRERWNPRSGDPPIVKILAIVVMSVVTLFCWGGAMFFLF